MFGRVENWTLALCPIDAPGDQEIFKKCEYREDVMVSSAAETAALDVEEPGLGCRFRLLCSATAVSTIGDGMALTAFPLLAERSARGSALLVSIVYAAGELPHLASAHIGAFVDRADRRRIVVTVEWLRAALLAAFSAYLIVQDRPTVALLVAVVFLVGLGQAVSSTATQAALPDIVHPGQLGRANGILASVQSGGDQVAGPALGGVIFAAAVALPFVVDAVSFVVAAVLLSAAMPATRARPPEERRSISSDVREGFAYFRSDRTIRLVAATVVVYAFCQAMVLGVLVVFVREQLGLGAWGYGVLIAVTSIGNIVGGLLSGRIDRRWRPDVILIVAGVVIAVSYVAIGLSSVAVAAGAGLFIEAVWVCIGNITSTTLRQRLTPAHLLGRTIGIYRLLVVGMFPIGSIVGGLVADGVATRSPLILAGGIQLLGVSILGLRLRSCVAVDERLAVR